MTADNIFRAEVDAPFPFAAGSRESRLESIRTAVLIAAVVDEYRFVARERGIGLRLLIATRLPGLGSNGSALRRVLADVIGNALELTPRLGRVRVSARALENVVAIEVSTNRRDLAPAHV
jgi:signal transduction histidine kinase